ncbi:hypothetical protein [Mycobacteroides abscessus]|uniref:hypothetical protein n=1 Tax=Mycobacteroides abscessus TaxID=36809 RepID=UPI0011C3C64E|nr:hypothetical protein [Mycobacteroides abscessus]
MTGVGFHWGGELGFRECRGAPRGTKRERRGHGAGMDDKRDVYDNEDHRNDGEQWDDEERDRE